MADVWATDVPISMPEPLDSSVEARVDMGTFCFTDLGIAHNFRLADLEVYTTPVFAPTTFGVAGGDVE